MTTALKCGALAVGAGLWLGLIAGCGDKAEETSPPPQPTTTGTTAAPGATGGTSATSGTTGGAAPVKSAATVTEGKKDLKEAVCVVCAVNDGATHPEPVAASIEYKGKGYYFCKESEKAEFISNPKKYAVATP